MQELFGLGDDEVFKAATGFIGGIHRMGSVCGALAGGVMALSMKYGRARSELGSYEALSASGKYPHAAIQNFYKRFCEQNKSALCREITGIDLGNAEERQKWAAAGGHEECMRRVGRTARLAAEFLASPD